MPIIAHAREIIEQQSLLQFIKFCIIGASNTIVSLTVYYAFVLYDRDLYLWGYFIGFIVSVLNSYYWNNKYVFEGERKHISALIKTYMMYGFTTVISSIILYLFVDIIGISEFIAPLLILFVTVPLNYLISKYWAFKPSYNLSGGYQ